MAKPKKRCQPYQQFQKERGEALGPIIDKRWAEAQLTDASLAGKFPDAGFRTKVVQALFNGLPEEHRATYAARAKAEGEQQAADFKEMMTRPPDASPEARHRALMRLVSWIAPILQEIFNVTGCHATLLVGGPQPEFGGDISVQHFSFGRNLSPTGDHWGQWDKPRFKKQVLEFFVQYLQTAYTAEDCARSAFATTESNFDPADLPPRAVGTAFGVHWPTTDTVIPDLKSDADESASDMDIDAGVDSDDPFTVANQKTAKAKKPKKPKKKAVLSTITQMVDDAYPSNVFSAPASAAPAPLTRLYSLPFRRPLRRIAAQRKHVLFALPGRRDAFGQQSPAQASGFGVGTTLSSPPPIRGWTDGEGIERTMTWNAGNSRARQAPDGSNSPNSPLRIAPESAFMPSISRSRRLPAPPPATNNVYFAGLLDFTQASASSRIPSPYADLCYSITHPPQSYADRRVAIVYSRWCRRWCLPTRRTVDKQCPERRFTPTHSRWAPWPSPNSRIHFLVRPRPRLSPARRRRVQCRRWSSRCIAGGVAEYDAHWRCRQQPSAHGTTPDGSEEHHTRPHPAPLTRPYAPLAHLRSTWARPFRPVSALSWATPQAARQMRLPLLLRRPILRETMEYATAVAVIVWLGRTLCSPPDARVPCPADAPKWFIKMHSRVGTVDLGHTFNAVVNSWVRVEVASRFKTGKGMNALPLETQPDGLASWMRANTKPPKLAGTKRDTFATQYTAWWDALQPSWRRRTHTGAWRLDATFGGGGREWGRLFVWGQHGIGLLVSALFIWGAAGGKDTPEWKSAVIDAGWMFEGLAAYYEKWNGSSDAMW
ncbi:hypothetical protein MKEN_00297100 [Mycena kentingensis (nom. inval.)]|nr:hypothetical protein MKEN_00297100 [Mycena kentingensis (nom. inval.)]